MADTSNSGVNALLLSLYSTQFPAIGESHGLSVVAGALAAALPDGQLRMQVLDMVQTGTEDCSQAVEIIHQMQADVLAVGLPYGTFNVFRRNYEALRKALYGRRPLIVLGGALATYLSDRILHEVAPDAVVIIGEADQSLPLLVQARLNGGPVSSIPNLHYIDQESQVEVRTARKLSDISTAALPFRGHIKSIHDNRGQIYIESSRGCSWSACTFCLRGLTDVTGRNHEYRRKPASLVAADLRQLADMGITDVTFADEDFLGGHLDEANAFINQLGEHGGRLPRFDASLTVHSVWSRRDSPEERQTRKALIAKLARMGLRKAFLGIESCSPSQLRRYAKGHTREEAVAAARLLQQLDVQVEIGVILFDPLCTLDEVADSLSFMRSNQLARLASGVSSELRLQYQSRYFTMLEGYERKHNRIIHSDQLQPDTLSYPYDFADDAVQDFFSMVVKWNRRMRPLYYPVKSLSRFGDTGAIGEAVHLLRQATESYREANCDALLASIDALKSDRDWTAALDREFTAAAQAFSRDVLAAMSLLQPEQALHPVVHQALQAASNTSRDFLNTAC